MSHFEVIHTDAEQPWHTRLVSDNNRTLTSSETFRTKRSAETNVLALARTFGYRNPVLVANGLNKALVDTDTGGRPRLVVRFVDERSK